MVSKGNILTPTPVTLDELKGFFESAYRASTRSRVNAAEAVAFSYLAYRAVMHGPMKKMHEASVSNYEDMAKEKNDLLKTRFREADDYVNKKLRPDHAVYAKATTKEEKAAQQAMIDRFKADAEISPGERRKLRLVSLSVSRENASPFMPVVRGSLRLYRESSNSQVSRYCLAMEWVHERFKHIPQISVPMIKHAISVAHGFDRIVEEQSKLKSGDIDEGEKLIIASAIRAKTKAKVDEVEPVAEFDMPVSASKDGYFLALVRLKEGKSLIVGDARAPENDIVMAVNRVGSYLPLDVNPACDFLGRSIEFADVITEGQNVFGEDSETALGKAARLISLRPNDDGVQELVFSLNLAEAGGVFVARPKDSSILGQPDTAGVIRTLDRRKLESQLRDRGNRCLVQFTPDLNPTTADGKPGDSLMSWNFVNQALVDAEMPDKATTKVYFTRLDNISCKPLDVVDFKPQCSGVITGSDIDQLVKLVPKPKSGGKATETEPDGEKSKSKSTRFVSLKFEKDKLFVTNGDADTLELDCPTGSKATVLVRLRSVDLWGICSKLDQLDCQNIRISPDDRGLVQFSWTDTVGDYDFNQPTCGIDGRLQSRRVAPMRYEPPQQIAAE